MSLLEVEGLRAAYGPVRVLEGLDFSVDEGQKVAVLGPNGAGKTTILRALCGMVHARGRAEFDGVSLVGKRTAEIARRGVGHVPEGRGTFGALSVEENLLLGAYVRRDGVREDLKRAYGWFPRLGERRGQAAGSLSGGEQQMLAVARALMLRPRLLMLDEPSLGIAPIIAKELYRVLREICDEHGMTVLLVEQNAGLALDFVDHAYVLESGRIALSGEAVEGDQEADGHDHDRDRRRLLDGPDQDALDADAEHERDRKREHEGRPVREPAVHQLPRHVRREHRHLTLREVDDVGRAEDQDEREGHRRVDRAGRDPVHKHLYETLQISTPGRSDAPRRRP